MRYLGHATADAAAEAATADGRAADTAPALADAENEADLCTCLGRSCVGTDDCSNTCCKQWEACSDAGLCACGPAPHYAVVKGACLPSCGRLLSVLGLDDRGRGCCKTGCQPPTFVAGPGETSDCNYCCAGATGASPCL